MEHNLIKPAVVQVSYANMEEYLTDPTTRIIDSRILELAQDFQYNFQVLETDGTIRETIAKHDPKELLNLFKLQYRNNPRNNPGLYGLLDNTGV